MSDYDCYQQQPNAQIANAQYLAGLAQANDQTNYWLIQACAQFNPPVPDAKPWMEGWREPQSEWAKIP